MYVTYLVTKVNGPVTRDFVILKCEAARCSFSPRAERRHGRLAAAVTKQNAMRSVAIMRGVTGSGSWPRPLTRIAA